ncbi:DUF4240 domain-containing protein [Actinoplanes couchii]|uniref:DUF4240 domain-containing protein n=1 Tax=Actinoplanes couchii TaxID=403638 RepID=A0ABQ3XNR8_9ACTN|nr:DUF4240 domain-containing protein [Actinoplanes couchii]MDR6319613.1 hypothetical protein [Actinoplanes couchii]GID60164.1 hypothetical protein Aco03nite_085680 [Actinoplanes couchii]
MNTDQCWEIIEAARADVNLDGDTGSLDDLLGDALIARLTRLSLPEIVAFEVRFARLRGRVADLDGIHRVCRLLTTGVGDDGFTDFCAGLVGLGRHWYDLVVADPDNLADHPAVRRMAAGALHEYALLAEDFQYAAYRAYEQLTGSEDELWQETDRMWELLPDDRDPAPASADVRLPRLETLFTEGNAAPS